MPAWLIRLNEFWPIRYTAWALCIVGCIVSVSAWVAGEAHWAWSLLFAAGVVTGARDGLQTRHSVLRNYPVIGHVRFLLEFIRPEIRQYFIEGDTESAPFSRQQRSLVYQRAKGDPDNRPFGTQRDVGATGFEWINHSMAPTQLAGHDFRINIGHPANGCTQSYSASVFNISAMSFGALSAHAVLALNAGAKRGGFAHDTGEGSISRHHRTHGGDLIWEIGSGYFGCRTEDGRFDAEKFRANASDPQVRMIEIKLSQGAKPGHGGVLPAPKVTIEIAEARGVPPWTTCVSPARHSAFSPPLELLGFVAQLRELSGGKPTGFKLCIGHSWEWFAIAKAMQESGILPDFIVVDGAEGGTGAAPLEFADHVGMPLQEGLLLVHNTLVGLNLRDRIRIGSAGKVISGFDIARMMALGADWCNAARGFMFALGCIQAQSCHTGHCPTGVTTQDPVRQRALVVPDKAERVWRFHQNTLHALQELVQAAGLNHPGEITAAHIMHRSSTQQVQMLSDMLTFLKPGQIIAAQRAQADWPDDNWRRYWPEAQADSFNPKISAG